MKDITVRCIELRLGKWTVRDKMGEYVLVRLLVLLPLMIERPALRYSNCQTLILVFCNIARPREPFRRHFHGSGWVGNPEQPPPIRSVRRESACISCA